MFFYIFNFMLGYFQNIEPHIFFWLFQSILKHSLWRVNHLGTITNLVQSNEIDR